MSVPAGLSAREKRVRRQAAEAATERRRRMIQLGAAAAFVAAIVVAALIAISQSGSSGSGGDTTIEGASAVERQLRGLDQRGLQLGDPSAKVTIVEFGDLQCPVCREYSAAVIPRLIADQVRSGEANLEFRNWTIIGPESSDAAAAALAAAKQGRYWSFIELFYRNQGRENSGYVTGDFLEGIARAAGVPDISRWNADRATSNWSSALDRVDAEATRDGFSGTPSFLVEGPGGKRPVGTGSPEQIDAAVAAVSR